MFLVVRNELQLHLKIPIAKMATLRLMGSYVYSNVFL
jgi:hypothetical protein